MTENKPTTILIILIVLTMLAGVGLMYSISQQQQQEQAAKQAESTVDSKQKPVDKQPDKDKDKIDIDKAQEAAKNSAEDAPVILISKEEASKVAVDEYGGVAKSVEDDYYQGSPTWEVEITDSTQGKIEVEVDKQTGEIVSMEKD